jgi:prepilin-type processing-associated H-X9-DG protein
MFCPKCGKENPDAAQLCQSCSWVLNSGSAVSENPQAKTCGLAITSLVLAILSLFTLFITAIPAIICGIVGIVRIEKSLGQLKGKGLAIAGIAIPGILLPVFLILLGILMPALSRTRDLAYRMTCGVNLSSLGKAMQVYANDNKDKYPTPSKWCDLLVTNVNVDKQQFRCKGAPDGPCNYAMNPAIEKLGRDSPSDMVLLFETKPGWNQNGGLELLTTENHSGQGCSILFNDGHVEFVKTEDLSKLRWDPSISQ